MRRRQPPAPPAGELPERLQRFEVTDWCDPKAEPPEWWTWANGSTARWSLAGQSIESYWYMVARLAWQRAVVAWHEEYGG